MTAIALALREKDGRFRAEGAINLDDAWHKVSAAEARGARLEQLVDAEGKRHEGQALVTLRASRAPLFTISAAGEGSCLIVR